MRGAPDHSQEPPVASPTVSVPVASPTVVPTTPLSVELAALGQEVLDLVPRDQRGTLAAYRQAARDLSAVLAVTGVRRTPRTLFYAALRMKWLADNTSA